MLSREGDETTLQELRVHALQRPPEVPMEPASISLPFQKTTRKTLGIVW